MSTTPEIIFDTTVLSNFAAVDQIALLSLRYRSSACTTLAVVEELQRGVESGYHYLHRALSIVNLLDANDILHQVIQRRFRSPVTGLDELV